MQPDGEIFHDAGANGKRSILRRIIHAAISKGNLRAAREQFSPCRQSDVTRLSAAGSAAGISKRNVRSARDFRREAPGGAPGPIHEPRSRAQKLTEHRNKIYTFNYNAAISTRASTPNAEIKFGVPGAKCSEEQADNPTETECVHTSGFVRCFRERQLWVFVEKINEETLHQVGNCVFSRKMD